MTGNLLEAAQKIDFIVPDNNLTGLEVSRLWNFNA